MRSIVIAYISALLAGVLALLATGCITGMTSLTGGSIPTGDIDGEVWRSSSRSLSLVDGGTVELLTPAGMLTQTTVTDTAGRFAFRGVPQGRWLIQTCYAGEEAQIQVLVAPTLPVAVALRLAPSHPTLEQLWLTPDGETITVTVGEMVQFQAWERPENQHDQTPLPVSWAVQGNIGNIAPDGLLMVQREGAGVVIAQYSGVRAQANVLAGLDGASPLLPANPVPYPLSQGK